MSTLVIYFHGLGGSPESSKVSALRDAGFIVEAPEIPIDPDEAGPYLRKFIDEAITKYRYEGVLDTVVFVGTSLGGFWAARMGEAWDAIQVLINPAMTPEESLKKYVDTGYMDYRTNTIKSLSSETVSKFSKYYSGGYLAHRHFFIAKNDSIVLPYDVPHYHPHKKFYDSDDHQGNSFFDDVVECIKSL